MKNNKFEIGGCLSFNEMIEELSSRPKPEFVWNGIKKGSTGLVFGPPKSGKTILCENLAISIAIGAKEFMGFELDGQPKKVLFISLEEDPFSRGERNRKQFEALDEQERNLMGSNFYYQPIDFKKRIVSPKDWQSLNGIIKNSGAEIVFIDSITRLNPGQLENSSDAETIMQNLREIGYSNGITLVCVHHTPKMNDSIITMDKIKGSGTFAQESDFAIGVNRTSKNHRYFKNVFFRYASDDDDYVTEFQMNDFLWAEYVDRIDEDGLINRTDKRRNLERRVEILEFFDSDSSTTYSTGELIGLLETRTGLSERSIKGYIRELSNIGKIQCVGHGKYASINYTIGK